LSTHNLDDDLDCDFTSFRYQIGTRTSVPDADIRDIQIGIMSFVPAILFRRAGVGTGILVYDAQRLLGRYRVSNDQLFDEVEGRLVSFPDHLVSVNRRITR